MALLKEKGIDKNTLVIFTSDNGHEYDKLDKPFFDSNGPYRGRNVICMKAVLKFICSAMAR